MRFSDSLRKGIVQSIRGGLFAKFRLPTRRLTLFFGDIFIGYLDECEKSGFGKEMGSAGQQWMTLFFGTLAPSAMKKLPVPFLNIIMKKIWTYVALMDDFAMQKSGNIITIRTKNEAISMAIGKNEFSTGLYTGILGVLYNSRIETVSVNQTMGENTYVFRIAGGIESHMGGRSKEEYVRLNSMEESEDGFTLKDAISRGVFEIKGGKRIYFRGRPLYAVENTLFHIIGNKGVILDKVQEISYGFFSKVVIQDTDSEKKLVLLKTLLQSMGWGIFSVAVKGREILVEIKNPPYGLQTDGENWEFLARTILGYLWLIDRKFRMKALQAKGRHLYIIYSR